MEIEQRPEREARATLLAELSNVREHLEHNERDGLQFRLFPPLTGRRLEVVE